MTDRGRATGAAGATLAAAGMLLGFEELTRLGLVAVALVLLSVLFVAATRPRVEVEGDVDEGALQAGQTAAFPLHIRPVGRRTHTLRLEQPLPISIGGSARATIPPLDAGQRFNLDLKVRFPQRGRYVLPPCSLIREDPFGLAARRWSTGSGRSVTVLPPTHPLDGSAAQTSGVRGDGDSLHLAALTGDEFGSIRPYAPGDDLRRIHWRVTAHRGELMTRHDERFTAHHAVLVLDPHLAVPRAPAVLEWGIELLASVVAAIDDEGVAFDLITADHLVSGRTAESGRRGEALTALALTPTAAKPPRLRPQMSDPFTELVRDHVASAGLVVLATGTSDPAATRDLLLTLPPGVRGLAFIVEPGASDAAEPTPESATLVETAQRSGWSAHLGSPETPHAQAWQDVTETVLR